MRFNSGEILERAYIPRQAAKSVQAPLDLGYYLLVKRNSVGLDQVRVPAVASDRVLGCKAAITLRNSNIGASMIMALRDLRKFAEQHGDIIQRNQFDRAYILIHS